MAVQNYIPKYLPSFSRKKARAYTNEQNKLVEELLPKITFETELKKESHFDDLIMGREVYLEIGFGGGEHLVSLAKANLDKLIIGCEVFLNGVAACLADIKEKNLDNILLSTEDAREVLEKIPDNSLDKIFILFPDPWPKTKHYKRRIIKQESLEIIHAKLNKGGVLRVATDHEDYFLWMLNVFSKQSLLNPLKGKFPYDVDVLKNSGMDKNDKSNLNLSNPEYEVFLKVPEDHYKTRYQEKAEREGRVSRFMEFKK